MKAKYIKTIHNGTAIQKLYRLNEPLEYSEENPLTDYIIASKVDHSFAQEVMLFPADANGNVLNWIEIGCRRGTPTHEYVMMEYGFVIENDSH
jgi:hypothetical protein